MRNDKNGLQSAYFALLVANASLKGGFLAEAEALFLQSQTYFDRNGTTSALQSLAVRIRLRRAYVLRLQGQHSAAEKLLAESELRVTQLPCAAERDKLLAELALSRGTNLIHAGEAAAAEEYLMRADELASVDDLDWAPEIRAHILLNRALSLAAQEQRSEADNAFKAAQSIFDGLPDSPAIQYARASARINRAISLIEAEQYGTALALLEVSQALLGEELRDQEYAVGQVAVQLHQAECLLRMGRPASAVGCYAKAFTRLREVYWRRDGQVAEATALVGCLTFKLATAGVLKEAECKSDAEEIGAWLLDWLDLTALEEVNKYATRIRGFFDLNLHWALESSPSSVCEVLSITFGRYAWATRLEQAGVVLANHERVGRSERKLLQQLRRLRAHQARCRKIREEISKSDDTAERRKLTRELDTADVDLLKQTDKYIRIREKIGNMNSAPAGLHVTSALITHILGERAKRGHHAALVLLFTIPRPSRRDGSREIVAVIWRSSDPATPVHMRLGLTKPSDEHWSGDGPRRAEAPAAVSAHVALRGTRQLPRATICGESLRSVMEGAWAALTTVLIGSESVFLATHQELSGFPWLAGVPISRAPDVRLFHGVQFALSAMTVPQTRVESPTKKGILAMFLHTPSERNGFQTQGETLMRLSQNAIPYVYADAAVAQMHYGKACYSTIHRTDFLNLIGVARAALVSAHGNAESFQAGPENARVTPVHVTSRLDTHREYFPAEGIRALILMSCSTGQIAMDPLGESGSWPAALQMSVPLLVCALEPIPDHYCPLVLNILFNEWSRHQDLRLAVAYTRDRLRSGDWCESSEEDAFVFRLNCAEYLAKYYPTRQTVPADRATALSDPQIVKAVQDRWNGRHTVYSSDADLRTIVESLTVFG